MLAAIPASIVDCGALNIVGLIILLSCVTTISFQEVFVDLQIPFHTIDAFKKPPVVKFLVEKCLLPFTENRNGLLTKCTPVNADIAKTLLDNGYKYLSPFKKWCPVKVTFVSVLFIDILLFF